MINKYILSYFTCIIFFSFLSCNGGDINHIDGNIIYKLNYLKLISNIDQGDFTSENEARETYDSYLKIPNNNYFLKTNMNRVSKIENNTNVLLHPKFNSFPATLNYHILRYVFNNGDMLFIGNNDMMQMDLREYKASEKKVITNPSIPNDLISFGTGHKILLDKIWYPLEFEQDKLLFYFTKDEKITTFEDYAQIPIFFRYKNISGPIFNNLAFIQTEVAVKYINGNIGKDKLILYYNWHNKESIKSIAMPLTDMYSGLDFNFGDLGIIDSKNRIYLAFYVSSVKDNPYRKILNSNKDILGHIIIFNPENDAFYNIRHPFWDNENKNEKLMAYQYVLGEDENIYYQLVTDKAYYIYKITPLWNEPMEETEYNPIFFEFHPELKAAWDALNVDEKRGAVK